jgi:hypothetical protein
LQVGYALSDLTLANDFISLWTFCGPCCKLAMSAPIPVTPMSIDALTGLGSASFDGFSERLLVESVA